jgi:hypothetical protein
MKKITLLLVSLFITGASYAQDVSTEEIAMIQDLFGQEKKEIIAANIDLSGVDSDAFWKHYDQYEKQRQEIGKSKLELLQKYTTNPGNMTNFQASELLGQAVSLRIAEDKLILNFTKKIGKATSDLVSVQFYQIEHYISDGIRFSILNNIDFVQDK